MKHLSARPSSRSPCETWRSQSYRDDGTLLVLVSTGWCFFPDKSHGNEWNEKNHPGGPVLRGPKGLKLRITTYPSHGMIFQTPNPFLVNKALLKVMYNPCPLTIPRDGSGGKAAFNSYGPKHPHMQATPSTPGLAVVQDQLIWSWCCF